MKFFGIGSSYGYPMGDIFGSVVFGVIFGLIALAAIIGLSVLCYIKFLGKNSDRNTFLGKYFHFDHFYIEQFLKILYMIAAIACPVLCIYFVVMSIFSGSVAAFFLMLLVCVIFCAVFELFLRLGYEQLLINIRQAIDVRALRWKIVGDVPSPNGDNGGSPKGFGKKNRNASAQSYQQGYYQPTQAQPQSQQYPPQYGDQGDNVQSSTWRCPNCGTECIGDFCGQCGTRRSGF